MTALSCKELTQMFLDKGGIFECNYEIKKCIVYPQNITCNIKKNDGIYFDYILGMFIYDWKKYITQLPLQNINNANIIKYHNYQHLSSGGFRIQYDINVDKLDC